MEAGIERTDMKFEPVAVGIQEVEGAATAATPSLISLSTRAATPLAVLCLRHDGRRLALLMNWAQRVPGWTGSISVMSG